MTVKIGLLGFGTVASGVPFLLTENAEKIKQAAQDDIEVTKILVKDDAEKERLLAAGHDYHFVTDIDELILDAWNQIEDYYKDMPDVDKRLDLCREYGIVYYYRAGEKKD